MEVATRRREKEVWQACDDLWALYGDMRHITGDGIRERLLSLGKSRGSPNEIYKYRKTWFLSRGISASTNDGPDLAENDPITRAVRLVHEQLKDSTENRIDALKEGFAVELAEKENALAQSKEALSQVLAEFAVLEQKYATVTVENRGFQQQLTAEIEVRRALEKEMRLQKSLHDNDKNHFEARLLDMQTAFAAELERLKLHHDETEQRYQRELALQKEQLSKMGREYSEHLMEVKLSLRNQEMLMHQYEGKAKAAIENLRIREIELRKLNERLIKEQGMVEKHHAIMRMKDDEITVLKVEYQAMKEAHSQSRRRERRADVTIARLRASLRHSHGKGHGLP